MKRGDYLGEADVQDFLRWVRPLVTGECELNHPPTKRHVFPKIRHGNTGQYARSNVMAAWVLDELSQHGPFGELGNERQFALQSAMFMIGHEPLARVATGSDRSA